MTPAVTRGWGVRLGLQLVKGIGEQHEALLDTERDRGPYASLADVVERTDLPEEVLERLIRSGAMDSLGRPRRELLWQLREVAGASRGRMDGRTTRALGRAAGKRGAAAGRPMDLRLPPTDAPALPPITESERIGDAYAVLGVDAERQVVALFRPALDRLGAVTNAALADRRSGRVRIGGLVVTRQHPMTAKGTVFLALEDETGMVNVTMWPSTWERLRGVVRRHALLLVDGQLQREGSVVNVIADDVQVAPRGRRRGRRAGPAARRPAAGSCRDASARLSPSAFAERWTIERRRRPEGRHRRSRSALVAEPGPDPPGGPSFRVRRSDPGTRVEASDTCSDARPRRMGRAAEELRDQRRAGALAGSVRVRPSAPRLGLPLVWRCRFGFDSWQESAIPGGRRGEERAHDGRQDEGRDDGVLRQPRRPARLRRPRRTRSTMRIA